MRANGQDRFLYAMWRMGLHVIAATALCVLILLAASAIGFASHELPLPGPMKAAFEWFEVGLFVLDLVLTATIILIGSWDLVSEIRHEPDNHHH
jgi:hypothetical protein